MRGTVIDLIFPRDFSPQPQGTAGPAPVGRTLPEGTRVLYAEDDAMVRSHTENLMKRIGLDVVTAQGADEALDLVSRAGPFDVALTDLVMPGRSGLDLARALRHRDPELPIVITTGHDADQAMARNDGEAFPVLLKPYSRRDLEAALVRALEMPPTG